MISLALTFVLPRLPVRLSLVLVLVWGGVQGDAPHLNAQQVKRQQVIGLVTAQKKYSIQVATAEGMLDISIPSATPVSQVLERPQWDWKNRRLRMELLASAPNGDPRDNLQVEVVLPDTLFLTGWFAHRNEWSRLWNDKRKSVVRYSLRESASETCLPSSENLRLVGRVTDSRNDDEVALEIAGETLWIRAGDREASLADRSILDLKPYETEVTLEAHEIDNRWVAQVVDYRRTYDPFAAPLPTLPRVLSIGDETSMAWHRQLCGTLKDSHFCYHPPEIVRGSASWQRAGCWLGDPGVSERQWNFIVFNVPPAESETSREVYQANLNHWLRVFQRANAKLIFVESVAPNPEATVRYADANRWAQEVLATHSEIVSLKMDVIASGSQPTGELMESLLPVLKMPPQTSSAK